VGDAVQHPDRVRLVGLRRVVATQDRPSSVRDVPRRWRPPVPVSSLSRAAAQPPGCPRCGRGRHPLQARAGTRDLDVEPPGERRDGLPVEADVVGHFRTRQGQAFRGRSCSNQNLPHIQRQLLCICLMALGKLACRS
jgi:hypothetical protein